MKFRVTPVACFGVALTHCSGCGLVRKNTYAGKCLNSDHEARRRRVIVPDVSMGPFTARLSRERGNRFLQLRLAGAPVTFKVSDCTGYMSRNVLSRKEMEDIALIIPVEPKRKSAGNGGIGSVLRDDDQDDVVSMME
jgi:hypothetical protein